MAITALLSNVAGSFRKCSIYPPATHRLTDTSSTAMISRSGPESRPSRSISRRAGSMSIVSCGSAKSRGSISQTRGTRRSATGRPYFIQSMKPKPYNCSNRPLAMAFSPLPMIVAIAPMLEL